MKKNYGSMSQEPTSLELENRALAREAASEGFVLLKNEGGALPLSGKKLALYGMGARKTVKGGLGSGSVEERYSVNIEDGLKDAGYEITTTGWLDDYDRECAQAYKAWHDMVEEKIAGLTDMRQAILTAHSYVFQYPSGRLVTQEDIIASETDTAVYVVMRQAGEGNDRRLEPGDYYLTETEKENLRILGKAYKHTILVINVGGLIGMEFLDEIEGIDAVVLFIQGGEEGGHALADVLSGRENFSGKLTATIPMRYEDIPFGDTFSYLGGDLKNSYYTEGIYVGYRYFDSFHVPVRFPFGFGLSYTTFLVQAKDLRLEQGQVCAQVLVRNTGSCPGREVVQLYISAPKGTAAKEYQRLTAFAKTKTLKPGQEERLELSFALTDMASYEEERAQWYLDAGDYLVRIGNSSRDTNVAGVIRFKERAVVMQCRHCTVFTDTLGKFEPPAFEESSRDISADIQAQQGPDGTSGMSVKEGSSFGHPAPDGAPGGRVPLLFVPAGMIRTRAAEYTEKGMEETPRERGILNQLTIAQQVQLLRGGDLRRPPKGSFEIHGAAGKTSTALQEQGIQNLIFSDGPAGINIVNQVYAMPDGSMLQANVPERYQWGPAAKAMEEKLSQIQAPKVYRYATAWPVSMLQAQTWDVDLLTRIGDAAAREMEAFGISVWLTPGMNIQKNPLGGRTFEYYSEDPLLAGSMAAALTKGVQAHSGCSVTLKHFCCNNIEDNRAGMSVNVSERALREIYLRGFELAVRTAAPNALMSSYNMVNHVYTANSHELLTDVLRCEWGYKGLVMTDWGSCDEGHGDPALCPVSGNDLVMPGSQRDYDRMMEAFEKEQLAPEQIRTCAGRVLHLVLTGHTNISNI